MEQSITEILSNYIGNTLSDEEKARIEAERNEVDRQAAEDAQSGIKRYDQEEQDKLVRQFNPGTNNTAYYVKNLFEEDLRQTKAATLKTGFKQLDKLTGGLHPGLYMLGAIPSLGKSTFCLQLADQVAAQGKKVLFFTLEQTRRELVTKSLNRLAGSEHTREQIESDPELRKRLIDEYIEMVENNLQIFDGTAIKNYAAIKGAIQANIYSKPMVIVDYLQIIVPEKSKGTLKLDLDYILSDLASIAHNNNLVILLVSSFGRSGYYLPVNFEAFKESGGIDFSGDLIAGLELDLMENKEFVDKLGKDRERASQILDTDEAKEQNPRKLHIKIIKNRLGGLAGQGKVYFDYYMAQDLFIERDGEADNKQNLQDPFKEARKQLKAK